MRPLQGRRVHSARFFLQMTWGIHQTSQENLSSKIVIIIVLLCMMIFRLSRNLPGIDWDSRGIGNEKDKIGINTV